MYYRAVLSKIKGNDILIKYQSQIIKLKEQYVKYWMEDRISDINDSGFLDFMLNSGLIKEQEPSCPIIANDIVSTIHIQITNACMCRCEHCYVGHKNNSHLSFDDFKSIIDEAIPLGVWSIDYTGGEPTLNPQFRQMIEYGKQKGLHQMLFTNGYINKPLISHIARNIDVVQISLDGDEKYHNTFRKNSQIYQNAIATLSELSKYNTKLVLSMSITPDNIHLLNHVIKIATKYNAKLRLSPPVPVGLFSQSRNSYYIDLLHQIRKECHRCNYDAKELIPRKPSCSAIHDTIYVDITLRLFPCPLISSDENCLGSFKKGNLKQLLLSAKNSNIAKRINALLDNEKKYVFFCPAYIMNIDRNENEVFFGEC